jgi:hypothetical protein
MNSDPDQHKIFTGTGTGTVEKIYPGPGPEKFHRDRKQVILQFPIFDIY